MARVRNIGAIGGVKPIPVTHFIPPKFSPIYKIEVITDTETIDITEILSSGEFSDGVTDKIGNFMFKILDPTNTYSNRIEEFDTVKVYLDYGTVATTLKFSGNIERKSSVGQLYLQISGRSVAMITTGINVTYSSNGLKARSVILTEIIEKYFNGVISTAGIEEDLQQSDVSYGEIPFWEVVTEFCNNAEKDAYIDSSLIFNYFEKGSRKNTTEAIVEDMNLIEVSDFAKDTEEIVTKVRVYGKQDGDVPIIYSSDSDTTQTKGISKELKKDIGTILTPNQAKALAQEMATSNNIAPTVGSLISLMLPTILPGEKLKIANPINNIPPDYYEINSYTHVFSNDNVPQTKVLIKKQKIDVPKLFKNTYKFQNEVTENINPRELDFSIIYDYSEEAGDKLFNSGTFNNIELEIGSTGIGQLKTITGATGTWISEEILTDGAVSAIEIRQNSTDLAGTVFFVSLDKGITFKAIGSNSGDFLFSNPQNSIILKANFKSSNTRIKKIGLLYST